MALTLHQLLYRASRGQNSYFQPTLEELELGRGQPRVLRYLDENGESSQNEVAEGCSMDPASVSRMAETLFKNGFIVRKEDKDNRRSNRLHLTEKGKMAVDIWKKRSEEVEKIMLSGFSEEEKENLAFYLERIIDNYAKGEKNA